MEKSFEIDTKTFIGGWYIPNEICDDLIKLFHSEKNHWVDGKEDWKKFKEMYIEPSYLKIQKYLDHLQECLNNYKKRYCHSDQVSSYTIKENVKIQHYKPGEGFHKWHFENNGKGVDTYRHLVFMTYLNTLENAGTEFLYQNVTTPCEKGLTLIWPATWTHTHKGIVNNVGEKYITTGWYSFNEQ